jgi:hypothetical protein
MRPTAAKQIAATTIQPYRYLFIQRRKSRGTSSYHLDKLIA